MSFGAEQKTAVNRNNRLNRLQKKFHKRLQPLQQYFIVEDDFRCSGIQSTMKTRVFVPFIIRSNIPVAKYELTLLNMIFVMFLLFYCFKNQVCIILH